MITIYGKDNCTFCDQAKKVCEMKGLEFEYLKIGEDITREQLIEKCPVPVRTVPQIFIDDEHIGGFTEFKNNVLVQG